MQKTNKKAFTLTELLIVVIVIGILSAVVLPKFNKIVETRKTTEADEMMAAVRTEQEKRCVLGKKYASQWDQLQEVAPEQTTKHYTYDLLDNGLGMIASSRGRYNYDLKMLTFMDGRICCQGEGCSQLNKDYPLCESLRDVSADTHCVADAGPLATPDPEPPVGPEEHSCAGSATRTCCGNGIQHRTCDTSTGQWGSWDQCTGFTEQTEQCNECGGTKTRVCNTTNGTLSWSACTPECECANGDTKQEGICGCNNDGTYNWTCQNHQWVQGNCTKNTTNCCTEDLVEWISQSGYTGVRGTPNCVKKTTPCQNYTLRTDQISYDRVACCLDVSEPGIGYDCTQTSSGYHCETGHGVTVAAFCDWANEAHSWTHWVTECQCDNPGQPTCAERNKPSGRCCMEYGPGSCRPCTIGPGQPGIQPFDPSNPHFTQGPRQFSFYYTVTNCPEGQCWQADCNAYGYYKNCHCVTGTWQCDCRH